MVQTVCRAKEIPLLLDKVIDVPVVQIVQLPRWWSRCAENWDKVVMCLLLWTTGAWSAARAILAVMDIAVITHRHLYLSREQWKCLRFSSSRRFVDIPVFTAEKVRTVQTLQGVSGYDWLGGDDEGFSPHF